MYFSTHDDIKFLLEENNSKIQGIVTVFLTSGYFNWIIAIATQTATGVTDTFGKGITLIIVNFRNRVTTGKIAASVTYTSG